MARLPIRRCVFAFNGASYEIGLNRAHFRGIFAEAIQPTLLLAVRLALTSAAAAMRVTRRLENREDSCGRRRAPEALIVVALHRHEAYRKAHA